MAQNPKLSSIGDDLPTRHDALDFQPYVDVLAGIILDADTRTPLTIGVFGSWGSGKTSLMMQVQDKVTGGEGAVAGPGHRTVWFNAWKYNQEDALWRTLLLLLLDDLANLLNEDPPLAVEGQPNPSTLLEMLREALYRDSSWTEKGGVEVNWTQAMTAGAGLAFNLALSALGLGLVKEAVDEARTSLGKGEPVSRLGELAQAFRREELVHYQAQLRSIEQFQENFEKLVDVLLRREGRPPRTLVVFVDDLDRCLPEKAVQVLEALKLFLDVPGCIFVLGLDREAIEDAVQTRYKSAVKAHEYLDKIIQLPFFLPPIESEPMRQYVRSVAANLPDARCVEVFALGLSQNPRRVKRTLYAYLMLWRMAAQRGLAENLTPVRLAKLVAIQEAHPDLYADLYRIRPAYLRDLEEYFRAQARVEGKGGPEGEAPRLPEPLQKYGSRSELRQLFCLFEEEDARFDGQTPEELRSYITLTRRANPIETPAISVARLPIEPEMVRVPAGPFLMGSDKTRDKSAQDSELPQHTVVAAEYYIGKYPVTNAEYAAFVEAARHEPPGHWREGRLPEEIADHPVVNLTWDDAAAYAAWLAERTGKAYRLPTEAEWEKAARGADGQLWPWGNEWDSKRSNTADSGPGRTTPVGQYSPGGDSPYGCADMAGNVWEWTSSLYKPYKYDPNDGREDPKAEGSRVLRGGSFHNSGRSARCAYRYNPPPSARDDGHGFRVGVSPGL